MLRCLLAALVVLECAAFGAAPARRYNEAVASPEPRGLRARAEQVVAEVAAAERLQVPHSDPRLERAAEEIVRLASPGSPPPAEIVEEALRLHGLIEPPPHLIMGAVSVANDNAGLDEVRAQLGPALRQGRYRRVAAATAPLGRDMALLLVALQESFVEVDPVPRGLPLGGSAVLHGRLLPPYIRPKAMATEPGGRVARMTLGGDASRFEATLHCAAKGVYQVELIGEDRLGDAVLANFPVYCGVDPPSAMRQLRRPGGDTFAGVADAETILLKLLNIDRAAARLPPLSADAALANIARAHSADMHDHDFFGHVSPSTGSAADRVRRAGLEAELVLENLARACSPGEVEWWLMKSPGHRSNILNADVTHVGIGIVMEDRGGGARDLWVTQLFSKPAGVFDEARTSSELHRRIDQMRRGRDLRVLGVDPVLEQMAARTARELAASGLKQEQAEVPIKQALRRLGDRYHSLRSVFAVASGIQQLDLLSSPALADVNAAGLGLGVARGQRPDRSHALYIVIIVATNQISKATLSPGGSTLDRDSLDR